MTDEVWRQIEDFPNYEVSNKGRIRSWINSKRNVRDEPKILNQFVAGNYSKVHLYTEDEKKRVSVARLVGKHFVGNPENKPEINHKDGNKLNNHAPNIEWSTRSENIQHAYDTGLRDKPNGEKNTNSKLTKNDVLDIRNAYRLGVFTQKEIAEAYNVYSTCIQKIVHNKTWSHL